ncbi:MAG: hypothetical protein AAFZ18_29305 [Myxococcota bacterium]
MRSRSLLAAGLLACVATPALAQDWALTSSRAPALPDIGDHQVLIESIQGRLDLLAGRLEVVRDQVGLLRETALGADVTETRAVISHLNELGSSFVLERAKYTLDGGILLDRVDENGSLSDVENLVLFDGRIEAGEHVLEVEVVCRGGGFGVFSYVENYRFRVTSRYVLKVREGRTNALEIVVFQRPDITVEPAKRLSVRYDFFTTSAVRPPAP